MIILRVMEIKTASIIGLGAEGSVVYYALRQSLGKDQVRVLAEGERAERLRAEGRVINGESYELCVTAPGSSPVPPDLLVFCVKSYQMETAMEDAAREIGPGTVLMSLVNGLSSEDELSERFGPERVLYSMSKINSRKEGNKVFFKPVGKIMAGEKDGRLSERAQAVAGLLGKGVPAEASTEILLEIWRKYMLNAACNTVEAIFRGQHRWFQRIPEACDAMECVMREIVELSKAMGTGLTEKDIRDLDGFFLEYDPDGMCSMVQDVINGKETEIEMFMGEALSLGRRYGVSLPVCRFVYDIIKSIDKVNQGILS